VEPAGAEPRPLRRQFQEPPPQLPLVGPARAAGPAGSSARSRPAGTPAAPTARSAPGPGPPPPAERHAFVRRRSVGTRLSRACSANRRLSRACSSSGAPSRVASAPPSPPGLLRPASAGLLADAVPPEERRRRARLVLLQDADVCSLVNQHLRMTSPSGLRPFEDSHDRWAGFRKGRSYGHRVATDQVSTEARQLQAYF